MLGAGLLACGPMSSAAGIENDMQKPRQALVDKLNLTQPGMLMVRVWPFFVEIFTIFAPIFHHFSPIFVQFFQKMNSIN